MTVDFALKSGVAVLKPRGNISGTNTRLFEDSIYEGMGRSGNPPKMVVDFADVYGMDSAALATMMDIALTIKRKHGRLGVVNVSPHVKNLSIISHLVSHFEQFDSEDAAVSAISSQTEQPATCVVPHNLVS